MPQVWKLGLTIKKFDLNHRISNYKTFLRIEIPICSIIICEESNSENSTIYNQTGISIILFDQSKDLFGNIISNLNTDKWLNVEHIVEVDDTLAIILI